MAKIITQIEDFLMEAKATTPEPVAYEPRMADITVEQAIALIQERTPGYFKYDASRIGYPTLFRGAAKKGDAYTFKPSGEVRKSAHSANSCYNLLLKDSWYPDRLQSLICTTSEHHADSQHGKNATNYRDTYVVVPTFGSRVGVCPRTDIYYSFEPFMEVLGCSHLGDFADMMDNLAKVVTGKYGYDLDLEGWKTVFAKFDKKRKLESEGMKPYKIEALNKLKALSKQYAKDRDDDVSTYHYLASNISYGNDRFARFEYGKYPPSNLDSKEVWTDGECVLIRTDKYYDALSALKLSR